MKIILADIIVGHFLPSLFGWCFLIFVLVAEGLLLSKYLAKTWVNSRVFSSVLISNGITTIIGYFALDDESIGGHLLNWIPVYEYHNEIKINETISIFISAFVASIITEAFFNCLLLKKHFSLGKIITGTCLVNLFTYAIGGLLIWFYNMYGF